MRGGGEQNACGCVGLSYLLPTYLPRARCCDWLEVSVGGGDPTGRNNNNKQTGERGRPMKHDERHFILDTQRFFHCLRD